MIDKIKGKLVVILPLILGLIASFWRIFYKYGAIHATDFETAINAKYYFFNILYPWNPLSLGSFKYPNNSDFFYGIIAAVSQGVPKNSQIILLTLIPTLSYGGVYLFLRNFLDIRKKSAITAALFYAFSPPFLAWFTLPYMVGLAIMPWFIWGVLSSLEYLFSEEFTWSGIVYYSSGLAILLSLITSFYFQNIVFLGVFSIVAFLFLGGVRREKYRIQSALRKTFLGGLIVSLLYLLSPSRLISLVSLLRQSQSSQSLTLSTADMVREFYQNATLLNTLTLAGGTSGNARYEFMVNNPLGLLIPIFVFLGIFILSINHKNELLGKREINYYRFFILIALSLIIAVQGVRYLGNIDSQLASHFLLAGFRRPDRLLQALSICYAVCIGFSIELLDNEISGILSGHSTSNHTDLVIFLISATFISAYLLYSGIGLPLTDPAYSEMVTQQPEGFNEVQTFLQGNEFTKSYDSRHRYFILPLYQPLYSYLRYNYPNLFYAGGHGSAKARKMVQTSYELIGGGDSAAIIPMGYSSVKWVKVLPESFSRKEHQSWRLRGSIRRSSSFSLFGSPQNYREYLESIDQIRKGNNSVYENKLAQERIYIPEKHVSVPKISEENFQHLFLVHQLNNLSSLKRSVFTVQGSLAANEIKLRDYTEGQRWRVYADTFPHTEVKKDFASTTKKTETPLVWGEDANITRSNGRVTVTAESGDLSVWIPLGENNVSQRYNFTFYLSQDLHKEAEFSVLSDDGKQLGAPHVTRNDSRISTDKSVTRVITKFGSKGKYLRFMASNWSESDELIFRDKVRIERMKSVHWVPSTTKWGRNCSKSIIYDASKYEVYSPNRCDKVDVSEISIHNKTRLFSWNEESSTAWSAENVTVRWLSPRKISVKGVIRAKKPNGSIVVPIVFGNAFSQEWELSIGNPSGGQLMEHRRANGYANMWKLKIPVSKDRVFLSTTIHLNNKYVSVYRTKNIAGIAVFAVFLIALLWRWSSISIKNIRVRK